MDISVIIPVYNAVKYIERAVKSALDQPESKEIILIWDGCNDGSLELCAKLAKKNPDRIKLLTHPDKKNHGAGASRNLGIKNATYDWIAFLDADDFYLPKRFQKTIRVIDSHENIDAVYETIGTYFENKDAENNWSKSNNSLLTGIKKEIQPEFFFKSQSPIGNYGTIHLNGLTIKKESLYKVGLFNEKLRLHQDTDICIKLSAIAQCYPGEINKPIAMRGVHNENRITAKRTSQQKFDSKMLMWETLIEWGEINLNSKKQNSLKKGMFRDFYAPLGGIKYWPFSILTTIFQFIKIIRIFPKELRNLYMYILLLKLIIPTTLKKSYNKNFRDY